MSVFYSSASIVRHFYAPLKFFDWCRLTEGFMLVTATHFCSCLVPQHIHLKGEVCSLSVLLFLQQTAAMGFFSVYNRFVLFFVLEYI